MTRDLLRTEDAAQRGQLALDVGDALVRLLQVARHLVLGAAELGGARCDQRGHLSDTVAVAEWTCEGPEQAGGLVVAQARQQLVDVRADERDAQVAGFAVAIRRGLDRIRSMSRY